MSHHLPTTVRATVSVEMPDGVLLELPISVTATHEKPKADGQTSDPGGWSVTEVSLDEDDE